MFRSFPLCLSGTGYRQSRMTLNGNPKGRTTKKWVFLCRQSFTLPKIYLVWRSFVLFLSLIGNYSVFLRSFLFTFFRSFDRESFFSFLFIFYFPSFHFFLFFLFIPPSPFLSLGDRVLAIYLLSLEEIPLSFASGERMRILFIGQGSK